MLAVSVTVSSFVIYDHAKPKDYSHAAIRRQAAGIEPGCEQLTRDG